MIAHLRGKLISKEPGRCVVEAAGVGYELAITIPTFSSLPDIGSELSIHVHTHVREDALALFGFIKRDEKQLFEKLISVSGIGPKLAMTVLSGMPTEQMVGAIRGNDLASLTKIPGIGRKTAERLVLELREKLEVFAVAPVAKRVPVEEDVLSALLNLGYQRPAAERAVSTAAGKNGASSFDALFREALATLRR